MKPSERRRNGLVRAAGASSLERSAPALAMPAIADAHRLYAEALVHALAGRVVRMSPGHRAPPRHGSARPCVLEASSVGRVTDPVDARLDGPWGLDDLA